MTDNFNPKYKRVLLKLSGEAVAGKTDEKGNKNILDHELLGVICDKIKACRELGVQVSIVVGAGNIWRGRQGTDMDAVKADHMGMLATVINAIAIQEALIRRGVPAKVMTAVEMKAFAEPFTRDAALKALDDGYVVVFGCGTGNPFFSTDTGAVLRAAEIGADVILLAKNIDGVYDSDPAKNPGAKKYDSVSYTDILSKDLKVIDSTAASLARDKNMKMLVFGLNDPENIVRAMCEDIGTTVGNN